MNPECFGWYLDRQGIDDMCNFCESKPACYEDWKNSGGRVSGFFDKFKAKEK